MNSQTWELLKRMHNTPGAGFYEVSVLIVLGATALQIYLNRKGHEDVAEVMRVVTLASLGVIFVECTMTILHKLGGMFFL